MIPKVLRKFGGIKSQQLATNPRYKRGEVNHRLSLHAGVRSRVRVKAAIVDGDCYSVLPGIPLTGTWVNKGKKVSTTAKDSSRIHRCMAS
jgi:hypothetical protein